MSTQIEREIELLRAAYIAFNNRDIDSAVALMAHNVAWPMAFKGGFANGREEVRAYWTQQWSEINPKVEPVAFNRNSNGQVLVDVRLVVRDLNGTLIVDEHVGHCFVIENGLIQRMEIVEDFLLARGLL